MISLAAWKERWKFRVGDPEDDDATDFAMGGLSADYISAAPEFDAWVHSVSAPDFVGRPRVPLVGRPHSRFREVAEAIPPVGDDVFEAGRWRRVRLGSWRKEGAIHMKEARTSLMGLSDAARDPDVHGSIVLSFGDNAGEVLATERGRARDFGLNAICRRAGALRLGCGLSWARRRVETFRNPSDWDSRVGDRGEVARGKVASWDHSGRLVSGSAHNLGPAFLEVFAGGARLTSAVADAGMRVAMPIDLRFGPEHDVLAGGVLRKLERWLEAGRLHTVWLAPPLPACGSDRPTLQRLHPRHARLGSFCLRVIDLCHRFRANIVIETHWGSQLWKWVPMIRAITSFRLFSFYTDFCKFGSPARHPVRIVTSIPSLARITRHCDCRHHALSSHGFVKQRYNHRSLLVPLPTKLAEYPAAFCREVSRILLLNAVASAYRTELEPRLYHGWWRSLAAAAGRPPPRPWALPRCPRGIDAISDITCGEAVRWSRWRFSDWKRQEETGKGRHGCVAGGTTCGGRRTSRTVSQAPPGLSQDACRISWVDKPFLRIQRSACLRDGS